MGEKRQKDEAVYRDPDIRGPLRGRAEAHIRTDRKSKKDMGTPDTLPERATNHRDLRGGR